MTPAESALAILGNIAPVNEVERAALELAMAAVRFAEDIVSDRDSPEAISSEGSYAIEFARFSALAKEETK